MRNGMIRTGALALVAMMAVPAVASGQDREMFELPAIEVEVFQNPLHIAAMELYETPARWAEAGELHEKAPRQLTKKEVGQFFGFKRAAILYFYSGETVRSRRGLERRRSVADAARGVVEECLPTGGRGV